MWQHEIIEDLKRNAKENPAIQYGEDNPVVAEIINAVRHANCFYFGDSEVFDNILKPRWGEVVSEFALPFPCSGFEYHQGDLEVPDNQLKCSKRLMLIVDFNEFPNVPQTVQYIQKQLATYDPDVGCYKSASFINEQARFFFQAFYYIDAAKIWIPNPFVTVSELIFSKDGMRIASTYLKSPFYNSPYYKQVGSELDTVVKETWDEVNTCCSLDNFLNCRNIYTENVVPPEKLNKSRLAKKKEPLHIYKILKIMQGVPKIKYTNTSHEWGKKVQGITAEHLCRGHFKTYTEQAPLFGQHVGRFWWHPQLRGDKKNGTVRKEYVVITPVKE